MNQRILRFLSLEGTTFWRSTKMDTQMFVLFSPLYRSCETRVLRCPHPGGGTCQLTGDNFTMFFILLAFSFLVLCFFGALFFPRFLVLFISTGVCKKESYQEMTSKQASKQGFVESQSIPFFSDVLMDKFYFPCWFYRESI